MPRCATFDADRLRPGLPLDVAALVDELGPDVVGIQLVNTSRHETRRLIVQAGAFGEHRFTQLKYRAAGEGWRGGDYCRREVLLGGTAAVNGDSRQSWDWTASAIRRVTPSRGMAMGFPCRSRRDEERFYTDSIISYRNSSKKSDTGCRLSFR